MLTLIVVAASLSAPITTITSLKILKICGLFGTVKQFLQESNSEILLETTSIVTAVDLRGVVG